MPAADTKVGATMPGSDASEMSQGHTCIPPFARRRRAAVLSARPSWYKKPQLGRIPFAGTAPLISGLDCEARVSMVDSLGRVGVGLPLRAHSLATLELAN